MGRPRVISVGDRYGLLTVIESLGNGAGVHASYVCRCECGSTVTMRTGILKKSKSCGCQRRNSNTWKRVGAISKPWMLPGGEASFNSLFGQYRISASKRKLSFSVSKEEFRGMVTDDCHYCGSPPRKSVGLKSYNGYFVSNGVDRKDNSIGYELENCVACCSDCNFAKGKMNYEDFLSLVKRIHDHRML